MMLSSDGPPDAETLPTMSHRCFELRFRALRPSSISKIGSRCLHSTSLSVSASGSYTKGTMRSTRALFCLKVVTVSSGLSPWISLETPPLLPKRWPEPTFRSWLKSFAGALHL